MSTGAAKDTFVRYASKVDRQLDQVPALVNFEKATKVPKLYVAGGAAAIYAIGVFFNIGAAFLVNTVGFIIPGYYSLHALFTSTTSDDVQWLTYWVVFSYFTVLENLINPAAWFSFYYTFKLAFILWLGLPAFSGAQIIFKVALRPTLAPYFPKQGVSGFDDKKES